MKKLSTLLFLLVSSAYIPYAASMEEITPMDTDVEEQAEIAREQATDLNEQPATESLEQPAATESEQTEMETTSLEPEAETFNAEVMPYEENNLLEIPEKTVSTEPEEEKAIEIVEGTFDPQLAEDIEKIMARE